MLTVNLTFSYLKRSPCKIGVWSDRQKNDNFRFSYSRRLDRERCSAGTIVAIHNLTRKRILSNHLEDYRGIQQINLLRITLEVPSILGCPGMFWVFESNELLADGPAVRIGWCSQRICQKFSGNNGWIQIFTLLLYDEIRSFVYCLNYLYWICWFIIILAT